MSYQFYKVAHLIGVFMVLTSVVGAIVASRFTTAKDDFKKLIAINHGIGLVISLVAGFGVLARTELGFQSWVVLKLVIWIFFAAAPVLIKKMPEHGKNIWLASTVIFAVAAWLAVYKPF